MRRASETFAGFSAKRSLPKWRTETYRDRSDWSYSAAKAADPAREVVLFADTFNRYFEHENLEAALTVLMAGGYRVHAVLPKDKIDRPLCCGRTFLSVGQVDEAKREMQRTLDALAPYVLRGVPVIGLEPSCLFTFRDELPALLKGPAVDALAANALLLEEFLAREQKAGRLNLPLGPLPQKALLHGHCHQKAFAAMGAVEVGAEDDSRPQGRDGGIELLRHGRIVRLRRRHHRRVAEDGRAVAAAGGAQGRRRHADCRRRHVMPASDP